MLLLSPGPLLLSVLAASGSVLAEQPTQATSRPRSELARLSDDLQELAERVRPSVAQVLVTGYAPAGGPLLAKQRGGGSGVILDAEGYVITNLHVIEGARRIEVVIPPPLGPPGGGRSIVKGAGRAGGRDRGRRLARQATLAGRPAAG